MKLIHEKYEHLISQKRLVINQEYLKAEQFLDFIATFKIGFCFYSWELINEHFNYESAPSGKLFMYMAAGVPVIASNISAFKIIEEYGAGVLVDDYKPETILQAVKKIENNFDKYSQACYVIASKYSFDKTVKPYIDFLKIEN